MRAALPLPFNFYQTSSFKLTQRRAFRIGLNAPVPQHRLETIKLLLFRSPQCARAPIRPIFDVTGATLPPGRSTHEERIQEANSSDGRGSGVA